MLGQILLSLSLIWSALAAPQSLQAGTGGLTTTTTLSVTLTLAFTSTYTSTVSPSTVSKPTTIHTAMELYAYNKTSPFHGNKITNGGQVFRIKKDPDPTPSQYCPYAFNETTRDWCPAGAKFAINNCGLSVQVPGGQQIYLSPDGQLKYTAPHSAFMTPGAIACPLVFHTRVDEIGNAEVTTYGFDATGFMACPMLSNAEYQQWQVYANLPNATVPLPHHNASECTSFVMRGVNVLLGDKPAAWQYY